MGMDRYFFDFDGVSDKCGLTMSSANNACVEALMSMPEYVAEKLEREVGRAEMVCSIRENEGAPSHKIVLSLRVEDANGTVINPPFQLDRAA